MTVRAMWRFRQNDTDAKFQEQTFSDLVATLALTRYGQDQGIVSDMDYPAFRANVPIVNHEAVRPYLEAAQAGQADILWPGVCQLFVVSAGTSGGVGRVLPVTDDLLAHFRLASRDSLLAYTARVAHCAILRGRHLFHAGSTALLPTRQGASLPAFAGTLAGIAVANLPRWVERLHFEPSVEISAMEDGPPKTDAIAQRTLRRDVTVLCGVPSWLIHLAESLLHRQSQGLKPTHSLRSYWPNLECVVHLGESNTSTRALLNKAIGEGVRFHELYCASEALIAAQDKDPSTGLRLLTRHGVFYEFLPLTDYDPDQLGTLGTHAVPLSEVKPGLDYVLVLTTPAGLCRYLVDDIVRFTSVKPPRLQVLGRASLRLNIQGENANEYDFITALTHVTRRHNWLIQNFHVAYQSADPRSSHSTRPHHQWWVELRPLTEATPTGPALALELDAELQKLNPAYRACRGDGRLDAPEVNLVMPGTFEQWMQHTDKWGGLNRIPRCRPDRLIANQLERIAPYQH